MTEFTRVVKLLTGVLELSHNGSIKSDNLDLIQDVLKNFRYTKASSFEKGTYVKKYILLITVCGFLVSCATPGSSDSSQNSQLSTTPEPAFVEESSAEAKVSEQVAAASSQSEVQPTTMPSDTSLPELTPVSEPAPVSASSTYTPMPEKPYLAPHEEVGRYKKSKSEKAASKKIAKKSVSKKIAKKSAKASSKKSQITKKLSKAQCKKIAKNLKKSTKKEIAMCKIEKRKAGKRVARRS